ncbi:MAG: XrtN system VIT domain-containing protein [Spirochaetia bacterium]|nr:XrtN system VIT domain-containing protein [Spirochaetia bacterium]
MENRIQQYFKRPVSVLGFQRAAWQWMLGSLGSLICIGAASYILISAQRWLSLGSIPAIVLQTFAGLMALILVGLFLVLLRAIFTTWNQFLIFTLIISAISFIANAYVLDHIIFPPFTNRTIVALWISFGVLGASFFRNRLPEIARLAFQPVLILGAFLCISYILVLSPLMLFSWFFVWLGGLGFLPYSPLFALICFVGSARFVHLSLNQSFRKVSLGLMAGSVFAILGYTTFYFVAWHTAETALKKPVLASGHNNLNEDLPEWLNKAARFPVNHVSEMLLQPDRNSEMSLFAGQSLFDPMAYLASGGIFRFFRGREDTLITEEESGRFLHLLFGKSHAHMERLWEGRSLITTDMDSNVQIHPELRVAYTETTFSIYNENPPSSPLRMRGIRSMPEEAIYTITVPPGSICTKLSLWVAGEERPARLTFRSKANAAYQSIVRAQRDPSYVEWLDGNRLRLRVFPVDPGQYRTVRIGIVSPLKATGQTLTYERISVDGPVLDFSDQKVNVDVFTHAAVELKSSGIRFKEKIVPDGQVRQWTGNAGSDGWSFSLPAPSPDGSVSAGKRNYRVGPARFKSIQFVPDRLIVVLNTSMSRAEWKKVIKSIYDTRIPITLLTNEWFQTSDPIKALAYLDQCEIPVFNLFPLYFAQNRGLKQPFWIVSSESSSIPLGELRDSKRFTLTQEAAARRADPEKIAVLNGKPSEYVASLIDLGQVEQVGSSLEDVIRILKEQRVMLPVDDDNVVTLPFAGLTLEKGDEDVKRPGSDLLVRLVIHEKLRRQLGRRFFDRDLENGDLVELAREGMIVSPVSTLIVLETENDYKRFGIEEGASLLGQSQLESPGGAPEPAEWILIVCVLLGLFFFFRMRRIAQA